MSQYFDATTGQKVSAAIAAFPNGLPKPGYRKSMEVGEYIGFDIAFADRAVPSQSVFLTDNDPFAQVRAVRDAARGTRSAFVTAPAASNRPHSPAPTADMSQFVAVRDAAREVGTRN